MAASTTMAGGKGGPLFLLSDKDVEAIKEYKKQTMDLDAEEDYYDSFNNNNNEDGDDYKDDKADDGNDNGNFNERDYQSSTF